MVTFKTMAQIMHTTVRYKSVHFKCYELHVYFEAEKLWCKKDRCFAHLITNGCFTC